jgi:hypothetical protein
MRYSQLNLLNQIEPIKRIQPIVGKIEQLHAVSAEH